MQPYKLETKSSGHFYIRPLILHDYDFWTEMVHDYDPELSDLEIMQGWKKLMAPEEVHRGFMIYWESPDAKALIGQLLSRSAVGFVDYTMHPFLFNDSEICYLSELYIRPQYRRLGVARAVMDWLMVLAEKNKWERVYWVTEHTNDVAKKLYEDYGISEFTRYHRDFNHG